jgi:hypothetical protein
MCFLVLDLPIVCNENIQFWCIIVGHCHPFSHLIIIEIIILLSLIFNNHVMHSYASHHYIS